MKLTAAEAAVMTLAMGAVIYFCRAFPFLFFSGDKPVKSKITVTFCDFTERVAPPAAMTVLAFNSLGPSFKILYCQVISAITAAPQSPDFPGAAAAIIASVLTAAVHLWKRNSLISIFGGTAAFMLLQRIL